MAGSTRSRFGSRFQSYRIGKFMEAQKKLIASWRKMARDCIAVQKQYNFSPDVKRGYRERARALRECARDLQRTLKRSEVKP